MPKGIPNKGYRLTKNRIANGWHSHGRRSDDVRVSKVSGDGFTILNGQSPVFDATKEVESKETDAQISARINERFSVLDRLVDQSLAGEVRALILSGPPGLGKSYSVEQKLAKWDADQKKHTIVKGFVRATGLFKTLWTYRKAGDVIVFDDADSIFLDDTCLNFLKAVCDTTEKRRVSYLSEGRLVDDSGNLIDKTFEFEGTIIFITNYDFYAIIDKGNKLAPHLEALISRSFYVDLGMKRARDYIVRIKQVCAFGLLRKMGLDKEQEADVLGFIEDNYKKLSKIDLRSAIKVATIRKTDPNWEEIARVTCLRNV